MTSLERTLEDLRAGEVTVVDVEGQPVAVANVDGNLFAFDDLCPHRQCSLAAGQLDGTVIRCPCHGSEFDVTTGALLRGPAKRPLATYAVEAARQGLHVSAAATAQVTTPTDRLETASALGQVSFFAGLGPDALRTLQELAFQRTFAPGELIVEEGRTGNGAYVVVSGKVEVVRGLPDRPQVLATFGPGEPFGELALLGDWKRTASVVAVEETTCVGLDRWVFLAYLRREPRLAVAMTQLIVGRLADTDPEGAIEALQHLAQRLVDADRRIFG